MTRRNALQSALAVPFLLPGAGTARAHAILMESRPPLGGSVAAGQAAISLRFNSRIDAARSRLLLIRADRSQTVLPIDPASPPAHLNTRVELAPGAYTIRWQVLAVDGHITRGDVPFTVRAP